MFEQNDDITSLSASVISSSCVLAQRLEQKGGSFQEAENIGRGGYYQLDVTNADVEDLNDQVQDLVGKRDVVFWGQSALMQEKLLPHAGQKIGHPGQFIITDITVLCGRTFYVLDPTSDWMKDELEFSNSPSIPIGLFFRPIEGDEALVFMTDLPQSRCSYYFSPNYMGDSLSEVTDDQIHDWMADVESRLEEVSSLSDGWDSYDAKQIETQVIAHAREILEEIMDNDVPIPQIVPIYDGGIQLEWHTGRIDFEIYLTPSSIGSYYWEDLDHCEQREGDISTDLAELRDCLIELKRTA